MSRRWRRALPFLAASAIAMIILFLQPDTAAHPSTVPPLTEKLSTTSPPERAPRPAPARPVAAARPADSEYTVRPGDSLSGIAARLYGSAADWPVLYWANHSRIGDPNTVYAGQRFTVPPLPATIPAPPVVKPAVAAVTSQPVTAPAPAEGGSYGAAPGSFEACVIGRESGGDPTAYNETSGASGLFGFLLSTWDDLGIGYPGGAYTAPPAVQVEGFDKLYAEAGTAPWAAYDGC